MRWAMILWWFASKKTLAAEILIWRVTITVRPCFAWELTLTAPRGSGCLGHMLSSPLRALTARSPAATVNMWVPGGRKDASKRKPHCLRIQGHSICSGNKDIGKVIFNLSQGRTLQYRHIYHTFPECFETLIELYVSEETSHICGD